VAAFRSSIGLSNGDILFGRFSRPEPNKWTDLPIKAFRRSIAHDGRIKLLLQEPPPRVSQEIRSGPDCDRFIILPLATNPAELRLSMAATDVVLHTSSIGESFGYGIAEPMNFGKPVITHSTPWADQAQLELVRHEECGLVASTVKTMSSAILRLASDAGRRSQFGNEGQRHIRTLADPHASLDRLEGALGAVIAGKNSSVIEEDLAAVRQVTEYLDRQQFGHFLGEQLWLRTFPLLARIHRLRQRLARGCRS